MKTAVEWNNEKKKFSRNKEQGLSGSVSPLVHKWVNIGPNQTVSVCNFRKSRTKILKSSKRTETDTHDQDSKGNKSLRSNTDRQETAEQYLYNSAQKIVLLYIFFQLSMNVQEGHFQWTCMVSKILLSFRKVLKDVLH